jgi:hypothetical protein
MYALNAIKLVDPLYLICGPSCSATQLLRKFIILTTFTVWQENMPAVSQNSLNPYKGWPAGYVWVLIQCKKKKLLIVF